MKLNLEKLCGKWWVQYTNFPMWLNGNRAEPCFNYSILPNQTKIGLQDDVCYLQNGKSKSIKGFDTVLNTDNTKFAWRGKGLLSLLVSKWEILYIDDEYTWAVLAFEKTLFTPSGYDIITKEKNINHHLSILIQEKIQALEIPNLTYIAKPK